MKKVIVLLSVFAMTIFQLSSCINSQDALSERNIKEGHDLAQRYCASCHQYPEPTLLDKKTWEKYVLPKMAPYLGFEFYANAYMASDTGIGLNVSQWNNIFRYYVSEAPEEPLKREQEIGKIATESPQFAEVPVNLNIESPATTLVFVDSINRRILFGDGMLGELYILGRDLVIQDSIKGGIGISNVRLKDSSLWILSMGIMHPSDEKAGQLIIARQEDSVSIKIFDSLQRPVQATYVDLNGDQKEDIILCEFGDRVGSFSWLENKGKNIYLKHVLRALPGSIKSVVHDFNEDGKPDIMTLMAQGDEGVFIYYNEGNGSFREHRVLRFSPSYGSNYLELADFNNDGFQDIITSNGDNGDYPPILKAYHGIRIFLNNGKNEFEEKIFLPVNGIGKVMARDFDMDGDLDLVSIAYFADFRDIPSEAFIYWENEGNFKFSPSTIKNVTVGRWIAMDAGDYDGDGDLDVILGNADFRLGDVPPELKKKWDGYSPSLLILKNKLH